MRSGTVGSRKGTGQYRASQGTMSKDAKEATNDMAVFAMKEGVSRFKRGLVLSAAAKLFFERGYSATTVDAIADELGASKRAIYDHFPGKSDILVEICEQAIRFSVDLAERVTRDQGDPAAN